jgi:hypothetical protein
MVESCVGRLIMRGPQGEIMSEAMIACPKCKTKIKLTESLAAPLIEPTRQEFERKISLKDADVAAREVALRKRGKELDKAKESMQEEISAKIAVERQRIAAEEEKKHACFSGAIWRKRTEISRISRRF